MCPKPSPPFIPIPDFVPSDVQPPHCALPLTAFTQLSLWRMGASCSYWEGDWSLWDFVKVARFGWQISLAGAASIVLFREQRQGWTLNVSPGHNH